MLRRTFLSLAAANALAGSAFAAATTSLVDIESTIASGKPVLIHVTAPWCGTCKRQKPVVAELLGKPEFSGLTKIDVDFDSRGDVLSRFRVQTQATMLVFKDGKEVGRQVGETDREAIAAFFQKAM
jgi:thioredoxin-like negative regulator of GroEL